MMRSVLAAATMLLACATLAVAGDGVQLTMDGSAILVSKDVGAERWAIRLDLGNEHPLDATGNVYFANGAPPKFIWCALRDAQGSPDSIRDAVFTWDCYGADRCAVAGTCNRNQWNLISRVSLTGKFFLP